MRLAATLISNHRFGLIRRVVADAANMVARRQRKAVWRLQAEIVRASREIERAERGSGASRSRADAPAGVILVPDGDP